MEENTVVFGANTLVLRAKTVAFVATTGIFGANIVVFRADTLFLGKCSVIQGKYKGIGANAVIF